MHHPPIEIAEELRFRLKAGGEPVKLRHFLKRRRDLLERAKAHEGVEVGEGGEKLRLSAGVAVASMRRPERDARPVLANESGPCLFLRRMSLEREWNRRGQDLNKVGKLALKLAGDGRAENRFGILRDQVPERAGAHFRRQVGMGAHPELGVRDGVGVLSPEERRE